MHDLKQKWSALKNSERKLILYGSIFAVIVVFYFYIWLPYSKLMDSYRLHTLSAQEDISFLKQASIQIKYLKQGSLSPVASFKGSFINTVDNSLKQNGLNKFVGLLENSGGDKIIIQFNKISFNSLIKWTGNIKKRYGILVKNIDLQRDDTGKMVNARIILKKM